MRGQRLVGFSHTESQLWNDIVIVLLLGSVWGMELAAATMGSVVYGALFSLHCGIELVRIH